MQNEYLNHVVVMLQQAESKTKDNFTMLSEQQLNWKPNDEQWSIAECIDHLIVTNEQYFKVFQNIKEGHNANSFWTKIPLWHKLGAKIILSAVDPDNAKKAKTFGVFKPRYSSYSNDIICDFEDSQAKLFQFVKDLDTQNHIKTKVTSPVNKSIVFTLKDAFNIIWKHQIRHFNQAKNLTTLADFPK